MKSSDHLLRELIAIPSVNPAFLPPNDPRGGEHRVAEFLLAVAAHNGLDVETQEVFPNRSNVLARLRPLGKVRRVVVLAPHLDTVGEPGTNESLFQPRVRNGRIYGRGSCDTKGSIAAMFTALIRIAQSPRRPSETEIIFAGLVDEEHGQFGSRKLAGSGFKADLAIVGEPTRLQLVTAHKGDLWLKLETRGKSAHGARPELGENAVHAMAKIVNLLETGYARQLKRKTHELLGHATINVGSIAGGTQPNIVPDRCEISADRRTLPGETEASVRREITALLRQNGLQARIGNTKAAPCPSLETNPQLPLVRQFMQMNAQKKPMAVDFFCDAAILARGGIPSVVFGPGDIAQAHTVDEWISLESLERGTRLLTTFLQSLA